MIYYVDLAFRSLKRNPVLTFLMVSAIAVGIGASMTTLTVMHILSGNPLPGKSAHLYYAQVDGNPTSTFSHAEPPDMLDYRSALDLWTAHRADCQALLVDSQIKVRVPDGSRPPLILKLLSTTADFFPMFQVPFQYGSPWTAQDDAAHARLVVISSDLNNRLFGGRDSVGKILRLKDADVRIVGVLRHWRPSPVFYDVNGGRFANGDTENYYGKPEDVFVPFQTGLEINDGAFQPFNCWNWPPPNPGHLETASCNWVGLWVELDSPAKAATYGLFLNRYALQQKELGRINYTETRLRDLMGWLNFNQAVPKNVKLQTWLAFAFLTICLCNTVGLLLANFLRRASEIGVRRALGASRHAVFAQCLTEAGVVGLLGGVGGWLLTLPGLWLVRQQQQTPYFDLAHMDGSMFVVTFVLALTVSLLAGAVPAFRASRIAPALQLKTL